MNKIALWFYEVIFLKKGSLFLFISVNLIYDSEKSNMFNVTTIFNVIINNFCSWMKNNRNY